MTLITIRRRTQHQPAAAPASTLTTWLFALILLLAGASAVTARFVWLRAGGGLPPLVALGALLVPGPLAIVPILSLAAPLVLFLALRFARISDPRLWVPVWTLGAPWLLLTLTLGRSVTRSSHRLADTHPVGVARLVAAWLAPAGGASPRAVGPTQRSARGASPTLTPISRAPGRPTTG